MAERHPFATFVRTLGRGAKLSRALDEAEAEEAMGMILNGAVEPVQLGAFLVVLRYRGETPEELAGFVRAARAAMEVAAAPAPDLDWPSYADRHVQLPWFVLSALLLAENGIKVAMHGIHGDSEGYAPTPQALASLGIGVSPSLAEAAGRLERDNFAYITLDRFCAKLDTVFGLRPLLGVRSAVNSFARELNPFGAAHQLQGVFHPNYCASHLRTAELLGQPHVAVFKGGGGEIQCNPEKPVVVATLHDGAVGQEQWPAMVSGGGYPWRDETAEMHRLAGLWRGEYEAASPAAAVVGTAAIALKLLGRAADADRATAMAQTMWRQRSRERFHSLG